jgi:hypothetical protein
VQKSRAKVWGLSYLLCALRCFSVCVFGGEGIGCVALFPPFQTDGDKQFFELVHNLKMFNAIITV